MGKEGCLIGITGLERVALFNFVNRSVSRDTTLPTMGSRDCGLWVLQTVRGSCDRALLGSWVDSDAQGLDTM